MQKKKKYFYISIIKGREGTVERTWAWQEVIEKEKENLEQKNQELQECCLRKNIPKKKCSRVFKIMAIEQMEVEHKEKKDKRMHSNKKKEYKEKELKKKEKDDS